MSDEPITAMRAPQRVSGRTGTGRPLLRCLTFHLLTTVLLAVSLLAAGIWEGKPGHSASVYQSGGIIADEKPPPRTQVSPPPQTAPKATPRVAPRTAPEKASKSDEAEPPPSSRQDKDGPLQAAPILSEEPPPQNRSGTEQADKEAADNDDAAREQADTGQAAPEQPKQEQGPTPRSTKAPPPPRSTGFRLFGTVEFKGPLKKMTSWLSVLDRESKNSVFKPEKKLGSTAWKELKDKLEKQDPMAQLQTVNRFWNQWPYRQDTEVYKKADYWAIPAEFAKNSGDCEDYAIAKYFTLKEIGYDTSQMRIVVLMETVRNIAHAVLVVYIDGDAFVLDNLSNNVLSHSRYKNYLPQYSVNEQFRWAHVRPK